MGMQIGVDVSGAGGMFTTYRERMSEQEKHALKANSDKIDKMVEGISTYLADVLSIKDNDVAGDLPLVEVSRQEIHHLLFMLGIANEMDDLSKTYHFVVKAEDLAERMRNCALRARGQNIDISVFTTEAAYYHDDEIYKVLNGNTSKVEVGAYGNRIMCDVWTSALEWLESLDKVMCAAASITMTDAANEELKPIKGALAMAIAKRMSLMSLKTVLDDDLSSRMLEKMVSDEFQRCEAHAIHVRNMDINGLTMLKNLAIDPSGDISRGYLTDSLDMLNYIVRNCPCEIDPYRDSLCLDQLVRALWPGMDIEVRVALVVFWADNNGEKVRRAIDLAYNEIIQWQPSSTGFIVSTIAHQCEGKAVSSLAIPRMSFLHAPMSFAKRESKSRRTGLDEKGKRAVRMIRCVWEMASHGIIRGGVVASEIVAAVGTDGVLIGRMAAGMIISERNIKQHGARLTKFFGSVQNLEGDHVDVIAKASCALSHFSCDELETAFRTDSDILWERKKQLENCTRMKMLVSVPKEYMSFASEAIAYALPILQRKRDAIGVCRFLRPSPVVDLLHTIAKCRSWAPFKGTLRVHLEDVRKAHSSARAVFDCMHASGVLVRRSGGGASKERVCYEFDTVLLYALMQNPNVALI
tara:strand:+ start:625 stop:2535 length:1911 start_codon:yes stop_codon:yes gene_type:complete